MNNKSDDYLDRVAVPLMATLPYQIRRISDDKLIGSAHTKEEVKILFDQRFTSIPQIKHEYQIVVVN